MNARIKESFGTAIQAEGFKRMGGLWYRELPQTIVVTELQKSQYGDKYYVNLGVWIKEIGGPVFPKRESLCHIRCRLSNLVDESLDNAFDGNVPMEAEDRASRIRKAIVDFGIPWLYANSTVEGIGEQIAGGQLSKAMVHVRAKDLVGRVRRMSE